LEAVFHDLDEAEALVEHLKGIANQNLEKFFYQYD
jgi:hypothetical protein